MKTLNQYILELQELQEKDYGDCIIIFSTDDEGNNFHKSHYKPSEATAEDLSKYNIEILDADNKNIPNVIIIN